MLGTSDDWLLELFGAMPAISGIAVSPRVAMTCAPVHCAVTAISEAIGLLAAGTIPLADGGFVSGPGSSRSDSIPARLSNGEFVVNAGSTAKHRALLESMNSGSLRGFADGGLVSNVPSLPSTTQIGGHPQHWRC